MSIALRHLNCSVVLVATDPTCPWTPTMTTKIWSWPSIPLSQTARHLRPSPLRWPTPASRRGPAQTDHEEVDLDAGHFPILCRQFGIRQDAGPVPPGGAVRGRRTPSGRRAPWIRSGMSKQFGGSRQTEHHPPARPHPPQRQSRRGPQTGSVSRGEAIRPPSPVQGRAIAIQSPRPPVCGLGGP